jgi:ubiquinone/menaquinone biosynthesis C-methylase UbiE
MSLRVMERIKVSVDDGYAKWAPSYDAYSNGLILLEEPVVRALLKDVENKRVLDVACGTGRHTLWLAEAGARVTGVDANAAMLEVARSKPKSSSVTWKQADVASLPFDDASFDVVLNALVMEHVRDVRPALAEAHRVLAQGGVFVLSVYHPSFLLKGVPPHFKHAADEVEYEIPAFVHHPSEYISVLLELGMRLTHFSEPLVNDWLVAQKPNWAKHHGMPLAIILRAVKER